MAKLLNISDINSGFHTEEEVCVRGWLNNFRSSGGIHFLLIRDGSGIIQCTIRKGKIDDDSFEKAKDLTQESSLEITGIVFKDKRAPTGNEIRVKKYQIFQIAEENFPISKKYHGPEFLLDNRHLWIRNPKIQRVLRIRANFLRAARDWFNKNEYVEFHSPTIITAACEGGSTLFNIKYFDIQAYLSQSWQLYAEAGIASLGKIFTIAPSFRAEKSRTRRHLTEYWHLEVEAPWCDLEGILKTQERLLEHVLEHINKTSVDDLESLGRSEEELMNMNPPFPRIKYDEAIEILKSKGIPINWGEDLSWKVEKVLAEEFFKPFFVTHFPKESKAFYHKIDPNRSEVTLSADLLAPEGYGEITGGGQRTDNLNNLIKRIEEENLNPKDYDWYIDLRRYGSVPHSGFGLGVERFIAWIAKLDHIRDAIPFPRMINRIYP